MTTPQNIAQRVIEKCGGFQAVADMTGASVSRVHRWTYARERGGTDGVIPAKHQVALLRAARERGIDLRPDDFFPPPNAAEPPTPEAA